MPADASEPRGVGGWLAFFVATLAIFGPIRSVLSTARELYGDPSVAEYYGAHWTLLQAVEWGLVAASLIGSWYLAWRLLRVQVPATVRIVTIGLWVVAVGTSVLDVTAVSLIASVPIGQIAYAIGPDLIQPVIYCAIWTTYLLRSRRVANTYRPAGDQLADVFA